LAKEEAVQKTDTTNFQLPENQATQSSPVDFRISRRKTLRYPGSQ
jgi:hypothetical protein